MRAHRATLLVVLPLALLACDMLKKKGEDGDASADAAAATATAAATAAAAADAAAAATATATATATAAPLGGGPSTPVVKPVAVVDGGKPADAGAAPVATDGGAAPTPTPSPTPTLTIPKLAFDAGAFRPPAGFPTAIPSGLLPPQK